jgi:hypothetical protein
MKIKTTMSRDDNIVLIAAAVIALLLMFSIFMWLIW